MSKGYFTISRRLRNNFLHPKNENRKFTKYEAWIWLIENANFFCKEQFIDNKYRIVPRGYMLCTVEQLSNDFKWDRRTSESFLKLLEKQQQITRFKTSKCRKACTLIKVNNYNAFQLPIDCICKLKCKLKCKSYCKLQCKLECTPYKELKKEKERKEDNNDYKIVLDFLNKKAKTNFKDVATNKDKIVSRLKDYSLDELTTMIDYKVKEWANNDMKKFLRPETLFNASKCDGYVSASKSNSSSISGLDNSTMRLLEAAE